MLSVVGYNLGTKWPVSLKGGPIANNTDRMSLQYDENRSMLLDGGPPWGDISRFVLELYPTVVMPRPNRVT